MWYNVNVKRKIIYIIIGSLLFLITFFLLKQMKIKYIYLYIGICFSFAMYVISIINYNRSLAIASYFVMLFAILFLREREIGYNLTIYLSRWIPKLFTNRIIFINVFGNIILFIPLSWVFKNNKIMPFVIILGVELLQLLLKLGIADIVDIILNSIGVLLGYLGEKIWKTKMKKNKNK